MYQVKNQDEIISFAIQEFLSADHDKGWENHQTKIKGVLRTNLQCIVG
jgi:antibiotic biosynthesis monooxygenase (ABM) superfamily enzyme